MLRAMFSCMVECYWELFIGARVVSRSWCQFDILGSYLLVCAQVYVVKSTLLRRLIVLLVVVGTWNRFCFFSLSSPEFELGPLRLTETRGSFFSRLESSINIVGGHAPCIRVGVGIEHLDVLLNVECAVILLVPVLESVSSSFEQSLL